VTELKTYSCKGCGHTFATVPPDDIHIVAISAPCKKKDSIEIPYECEDCHFRNMLYWDIEHKRFEDDFERINVGPSP
jgi:DNA-directed RNA polymerase subunit RPC12/RpoP